MLTEREVVDVIETLPESGHIQVRKATIIERDGVEISRTFHRHVVDPDKSLEDMADEDKVVRAIKIAREYPDEVLEQYAAAVALAKANGNAPV